MRGRQVFMDSLVAQGVDCIFGNPGTTESPLLDSLADYPQIRYFVALHEGVAVGAAKGYTQASGRTAVVNLHVAPGLGNGIGMIYGALKAGTPMLVTAPASRTRACGCANLCSAMTWLPWRRRWSSGASSRPTPTNLASHCIGPSK